MAAGLVPRRMDNATKAELERAFKVSQQSLSANTALTCADYMAVPHSRSHQPGFDTIRSFHLLHPNPLHQHIPLAETHRYLQHRAFLSLHREWLNNVPFSVLMHHRFDPFGSRLYCRHITPLQTHQVQLQYTARRPPTLFHTETLPRHCGSNWRCPRWPHLGPPSLCRLEAATPFCAQACRHMYSCFGPPVG